MEGRRIIAWVGVALLFAAGSAAAKDEIPGKVKEQATVREGRRLFLESSCMTCHSVAGQRGKTAPALDGVGQRRTAAYIEQQIRDPQTHPKLKIAKAGKSKMVQADLFDDEIKQLAAYLKTLPKTAKPKSSRAR